MATGKETLYAQFSLLNYLRGSRDGRTVREMLNHLHHNTRWGREQLESGPPDRGQRNVQNWLAAFFECPEFGPQIERERDPDNRKQLVYRSTLPPAGKVDMPIEEACMILMAEKLLDVLLPAEFYDASLRDLFRTAREVLEHYEREPRHAKWKVSDYLKRIAIVQRGQELVQRDIPYDVLGVISRAMLDGKCIEARYKGSKRCLHPYGLVLRGPKIYLLAVDDHAASVVPADDLHPAHFLCVRFTKPQVSDRNNKVPAEFDAEKYIARGGLEVESHEEAGLPARGFTLKLRIYDGDNDNLRQDLEEFPLSKGQTITKEKGAGQHLLTAPGVRASHQLTEWILGRLDRVEVIAPRKLRRYITDQVAAIQARYAGQ